MKINGNFIVVLVSERLGDTLFYTPAIRLLRAHKPSVEIIVIAPSAPSLQVFAHNPYINEVFQTAESLSPAQLKRCDTVIDLHNSKISKQYHSSFPNAVCWVSPRKGMGHQSEIAYRFMQELLGIQEEITPQKYDVFPQASDSLTARNLLLEHGAHLNQSECLIGCHLGNSRAAKKVFWFWRRNVLDKRIWPIERYAELMHYFQTENPDVRWVLTGSATELPLLDKLKDIKSDRLINLMGKTSVLSLAALMPYLKVFLTSDTGPMHVAAATEVPIVGLLGPTDPGETGPWPKRPQHIVVKENPLSNLNASRVAEALKGFLV